MTRDGMNEARFPLGTVVERARVAGDSRATVIGYWRGYLRVEPFQAPGCVYCVSVGDLVNGGVDSDR